MEWLLNYSMLNNPMYKMNILFIVKIIIYKYHEFIYHVTS